MFRQCIPTSSAPWDLLLNWLVCQRAAGLSDLVITATLWLPVIVALILLIRHWVRTSV